jgi:hypothetical protein
VHKKDLVSSSSSRGVAFFFRSDKLRLRRQPCRRRSKVEPLKLLKIPLLKGKHSSTEEKATTVVDPGWRENLDH